MNKSQTILSLNSHIHESMLLSDYSIYPEIVHARKKLHSISRFKQFSSENLQREWASL